MYKLLRYLIYSNGKIIVEFNTKRVCYTVMKGNKIIDSGVLDYVTYKNRVILDTELARIKTKNLLLYLEDDYINVRDGGRCLYVIRGKYLKTYIMSNLTEKISRELCYNYDYCNLSFYEILKLLGITYEIV